MIAQKPSLRMVSQAMLSLEGSAIVWATSMDSLRETTKARTKARVMCGVYYLQVHEKLFSGNHGNVSATCRICQNGDENRMHFMLGCEATGHKRVPHLQRVAQLLDSVHVTWSELSAEVQLQVLLDPSHESLPSTIRDIQEDIETVGRDLAYSLHHTRIRILKEKYPWDSDAKRAKPKLNALQSSSAPTGGPTRGR
jgi:hypothetical protein